METRLLRAAEDPEGAIAEAAAILKRGGLVAFPTETVYGLGALGLNPEAVARIFAAKDRPHSDPLILHIAEERWITELVAPPLPESFWRLTSFWPGPLTLVLRKSDRVPEIVTAGGPTVAVRAPNHPLALALIRAVGEPLAAPSANLFSRPSPTSAEDVLEDLDGRIDAVLDGGRTTVGVESTVLDLSGPQPVLLRPGKIERDSLSLILREQVLTRGEVPSPNGSALSSPGLLERHYSPRAEVLLFDGPKEAVIAAMREAALQPGRNLVLAFGAERRLFADLPAVRFLGPTATSPEVARNLYREFRKADRDGFERIIVRMVPEGGMAEAIIDRLRRAASGRVRTVG
jgi:L-threonylcarbamoyladenylate synthase